MIPEFGTTLPLSIPNWLTSSLKPRAQLYMEVAGDHNDHWPRVDFRWDKRWARSKVDSALEVELSSGART